ncbi:transposase [Rhodopseudomonas sp. P2A-2r]|uniref:transposase n=1 Tax=unclassified Rhodopseudomonas TaxID=2638247 RepID=UPI0022346460|nr:transposase [Rhodopseudomonas sp. P2A-2r]UZE46903.1 transposase [Rhodopseudomonas sp. P2A-2r]
MRHSQHTDSEIIHLLHEAETGIPIAEICSTAHVSLRTFYRWRKRYGSLTPAALLHMKELQLENQRLKALVSRLSERRSDGTATASPVPRRADYGSSGQRSASPSNLPPHAHGASLGRFASVRGMR